MSSSPASAPTATKVKKPRAPKPLDMSLGAQFKRSIRRPPTAHYIFKKTMSAALKKEVHDANPNMEDKKALNKMVRARIKMEWETMDRTEFEAKAAEKKAEYDKVLSVIPPKLPKSLCFFVRSQLCKEMKAAGTMPEFKDLVKELKIGWDNIKSSQDLTDKYTRLYEEAKVAHADLTQAFLQHLEEIGFEKEEEAPPAPQKRPADPESAAMDPPSPQTKRKKKKKKGAQSLDTSLTSPAFQKFQACTEGLMLQKVATETWGRMPLEAKEAFAYA